jgi:hypothetical protein
MWWPTRGVYFFFEPGEVRHGDDGTARVVRIGTHALKRGSRTTLWQRLSQHRGAERTGGGNHRGSIFRLLVGAALAAKTPDLRCPTWGSGSSADRSTRQNERDLEAAVSKFIGRMNVLCLPVEDAPGPDSLRGYIEQNAIALLSNFNRPAVDTPSMNWLGRNCPREKIRRSGLWNSNHVEETYRSDFLDVMEECVREARP